MLDVRRMRVLREVAARGSFSAAAEALSFTQSAVSQQVASLEREAGAQLVERGPRGIRLTDAGRALVTHANAILARLDDAEEELAAIAGLRGGRLRLGTFPSAGATVVPQAVALFRERYPGVELTLVEGEPEHTVPRLKAGDVDVTLIYEGAGFLPADPDLDRVHLLDDELFAVLPKGHPATRRKSVKLADLDDDQWQWISGPGPGSCHAMLVQACVDCGFEPRIIFQTNDHLTIQAFVALGVGVALLPKLALAIPMPDVDIRPIRPDPPKRRISAACLADGYRSPALEAMLEILVEVAADYGKRTPLAVAS